MAYKYVWRGLEEMFEFAPDPGLPTIEKTRGPNLGPLRSNRKIHIARQ